MHNKAKRDKPVELVRKQIVTGSWHGRDAWRLALKRMLSFVGISFVYFIGGALISFENFALRLLFALAVVGVVCYYQYGAGMSQGAKDVTFGEILYTRREEGHVLSDTETERSFHPFKGFFVTLVGCAPFVVFAIVFAFLTEKITYTLGTLPSWTESLMDQTEFAAALGYYQQQRGITALDVMRVVDRAMIMPFISVASQLGNDAALLMERFSPLLALIAPLGYGVGYTRGQSVRDKVNTGIKLGDEKKKSRERKARKKRQRSSAPERLI